MIKNFDLSNEIKFTTLSDVPVSDIKGLDTTNTKHDTITISTTKCVNGKITNDSFEDDLIMSPISKNAKAIRLSKTNTKELYLLISIGWIVFPAFRFFSLCPEVIWCDVISYSNNKGFNLLTFSCHTSVDKQVIFSSFEFLMSRDLVFGGDFNMPYQLSFPSGYVNV